MKKSTKLKTVLISLQGVVLILTILPLYQLMGLYSFLTADTIMTFAFVSLFLSTNVCLTFFPYLKATRYADKGFIRFLWIYALSAFAVLTTIFSFYLNQLDINLSIIYSFVFIAFYGFISYYIMFHFTKNTTKSLIYAFLAPLFIAGALFIAIFWFFKFLMYNFGGIGQVSNSTSSSDGGGNAPIDMSGKASHIEHEGRYTHLVLLDGTRIQLYNWYSAYGEGSDYAGKKYKGLLYIKEVQL